MFNTCKWPSNDEENHTWLKVKTRSRGEGELREFLQIAAGNWNTTLRAIQVWPNDYDYGSIKEINLPN